MTTYDWKAKWQPMTRGGYRVVNVGELPFATPEGRTLMAITNERDDYDHQYFANGRRRKDRIDGLDLIAIPSPPRNWASAGDVDPAIDRVRPKDASGGYRPGLPVCHFDERGLLVLKPWSDDEQAQGVVLTYKDLLNYEYQRRGCPVWRAPTCQPEGGV